MSPINPYTRPHAAANPHLLPLTQRERKNAIAFNHVYTLHDLDHPSAQRIQQLQRLLDPGE